MKMKKETGYVVYRSGGLTLPSLETSSSTRRRRSLSSSTSVSAGALRSMASLASRQVVRKVMPSDTYSSSRYSANLADACFCAARRSSWDVRWMNAR